MADPVTELVPHEPTNAPAGSPLWWVDRLERELAGRQALIEFHEAYFEGRHRLSFASSRFREAFADMLAAVSDNWLPLVVEAPVERLHVQGFRFGEGPDGDADAWQIWQENGLDAESELAFTEAVKHGEAYLLTWWDHREQPGVFGRLFSRRGETRPIITVEHPSQVVVARAAGDRRHRAAALKKWQEDDGSLMATLYLPDSLHRFEKQRNSDRWAPRRDAAAEESNPLGVVPMVPLVNTPAMLPSRPPHGYPREVGSAYVGLGRSDMADAIPTIDQINKLLCDQMVASEVGAFRQRWATGLEVPTDEQGEPREPFEAAADRLWISTGKDTNFGEFSATDLSNFTGAHELRLNSLASRTRIPAHYFKPSGQSPSAESLKATETGLVTKTHRKQRSFGEGLEENQRLAFAVLGDPRAEMRNCETRWGQVESRSESEYVDSLVKKLSLGVPKEQLWRDAGYSEQQVADFKQMLRREAELQGLVVDPGEIEEEV